LTTLLLPFWRCRLLALWLLLGLAGCAPAAREPVYRIGFSQCTTGDAWRRTMLAGMEKELSFHPNVQFQMLDAHNDTDLQRRHVQEFMRQRVDVLIISPNQSGPLTGLAEAAEHQGIPVIILDRRLASPRYTAYVGGNNLEVGRTAARYAAQLLHGRGQVLELLGRAGSSPATDRHLGFTQALAAYPGLRPVGQLAGDWQPGPVLAQLPALLRQHPETTLIFAHNDPMAQAARRVTQELGLGRRIRIIGVDGLPGPGNGLQLVASGALTATLLYSPGGEEAIRTALRILKHQPFAKDNILVTMVVDSANVRAVQGQTERLAAQQGDIFRQQQRWQAQQQRYATQKMLVYLLLASLLGAVVLGALAWRSSRLNQRIRRVLEGQNAEIRTQRNQIEELAEQARAAAEEVRRTSEAKLRFFTNFSHELRTHSPSSWGRSRTCSRAPATCCPPSATT